ncbi:MAG: hypothetical protein DCE90_11015 [Pseudanabaena sp.]|nr:MAG: hypothetical protein DCE90_11015 [Pseudanabaena sp.]
MMTAQYQAALHSYAEGRYEEAMQQFSELLYEDPRNPKLHIWLGATFRKAGKIEYAKVQYQQVLTLTDDPDLLDLASTSLAQIQNKLANGESNRSVAVTAPVIDKPIEPVKLDTAPQHDISENIPSSLNGSNGNGHYPSDRALKLPLQNGTSLNGSADSKRLGEHFYSDDQATVPTNLVDNHVSVVATGTDATKIQESKNPPPLKLGPIPPPPAIAALFKEQSVIASENALTDDHITDEHILDPLPQSLDSPVEEIGGFEQIESIEIEEHQPIEKSKSLLGDTIANIQRGHKRSKKSEEPKKEVIAELPLSGNSSLGAILFDDVDISPSTSIDIPVDNTRNIKKKQRKNKPAKKNRRYEETSQPIALEDIFKLSSVSQKITLWGALVSTIPAIALGVATYQIGDGLLLGKVRQQQKTQALAIAKATGNFLQQQVSDIRVLQKLLMSSEIGRNTLQTNRPAAKPSVAQVQAQQRQYRQQLTNRLNLYSQVYPQYINMTVFDTSGNVVAQAPAKTSNTVTNLDPSLIAKVSAADNVFLNEPVTGKDGTSIYALVAVKNSVSQKVDTILQVEIPLNPLETSLRDDILAKSTSPSDRSAQVNGVTDFYLINSSNRYVASSQPVSVGGEALDDFAMLPELRSANSADLRDITRSDRNTQILAYAPVLEMQNYGLAPWDVLTTVNKSSAAVGSQQLLMAIGLGIAGTPLLVATIAYVLSRKLSSRLKEIRMALKALLRGDAEFVALSVAGHDELSDISASINTMTSQFQIMLQKQEQEKQRLQLQVVKLFKVLAKLARDEKQDAKDEDLTDENILRLGKKVRSEMVQRNAELEGYRRQKEELQGQLMQMLREMQSLADGDLTVSTKAVNSDLNEVTIFFDDVMRGLQNIVNQVKSSANQVNFSLGQNEQAIANLASVSQRQVDVVTRSLNTAQMSKLSATKIVDTSQQALQTSQTVAEYVADGDRSLDGVMDKVNALQSTVATTAKRVKHLGEASQKIAKAISTINEIAVKTNFLAISATLAASRKGDSHNSFVMVAEEVGELAARSVAVSKEVETLISNIQLETGEVMAVVETGSQQVSESTNLAIAAKNSLQQISLVSQQIDGLMSSISEATLTQVQTSEGVANLMKDISHIAQRTLVSSGEVSKFMKTTKRYSGDLQESLSHFKTR